jgi:hypothetical protein
MITLSLQLMVRVRDTEQYQVNPAKWYPVVGTSSQLITDQHNQQKRVDQFLIINDIGKMLMIYPSKCVITHPLMDARQESEITSRQANGRRVPAVQGGDIPGDPF